MPEKRIQIGSHARFEMKRRGIAVRDVIATVLKPGQIVPSKKRRRIFQSFLGANKRLLLRVIVKETPTAYHVVTAYKKSKIAKYWNPP